MSVQLRTPSPPLCLGLSSRPGKPSVPTKTGRDSTVDLIRALCLLVVVALHTMMAGVERTSDGGLLTSVALAGTDWFVPVSWFIQVMPLFFIAGGFASLTQWRRMRARGASWQHYVISRTQRLAVPAVVLFGVVGVVLVMAGGSGLDAGLVAEVRLRVGQPLWFLAVYLGVTALVPFMARWHEKRPGGTVAALGLGVVAVDAARFVLDTPALGLFNLALVWLLMQQLGFLFHDGAAARWPRGRLYVGLAVSLLTLFAVVTWGPYSADMLVNLNPPTAAIVLLGSAQFFALRLLKPRLDASRVAASIGATISARAMTIYLWHMPVVLGLVFVLWTLGFPLPEPHSGSWWATRLPWLLAVAAVLFAVVPVLDRVERRLAQRLNSGAAQGAVVRANLLGVPTRDFHRMQGPGAVLTVVMAIAGVVLMLTQALPLVPTALLSVGLLAGSVLVGRMLDRVPSHPFGEPHVS